MRLTGARVFDLHRGFVSRDLCMEEGVITPDAGGQAVSLPGCILIPGLTDLHFHGCRGADFSDGDPAGLQTMADYELSRGVTQICPAGMTLDEPQLLAVCRTAAAHAQAAPSGAALAGVNLEGPFLSHAKKGAQNGDWLRNPDPALLERLKDASGGLVKLVSVAPELPGALDFIRAVRGQVTVSLAHTACDYNQAMAAFAAGARQVTHLFNAMNGFAHRDPGPVGAAADSDCMVELICDGLHIHPAVIRATYQLFGDKLNLISDSLRCAGMPDGDYELGGQPIVVKNHRATLLDGTLAGSSISLLDAVRNVVRFGLPLAEAVYAASAAPALAARLDAGMLRAGAPADLLVLDRELALKAVFVDGKEQNYRP